MNERLKELLAEQATSYTWNGNDVTEELDEQKFAELIVLECCQKLEDDGMFEVAMEMKQHFGVEE